MRHRSARKYRRTAAIVPSWTTAVNAEPGSSQPRNAGMMRRWAVLEIGRNSVSPCTTPSTMAWRSSIRGARYRPRRRVGRWFLGQARLLQPRPALLLEVELLAQAPRGLLIDRPLGVQAVQRLALGAQGLALDLARGGQQRLLLFVGHVTEAQLVAPARVTQRLVGDAVERVEAREGGTRGLDAGALLDLAGI